MGSKCGYWGIVPTATSAVFKSTRADRRQVGLGAHVVKTLTSDLKHKYHDVYFDNFFTSVQLLEQLEEDEIYSCGTARKDRRGFPPALKAVRLRERYVTF